MASICLAPLAAAEGTKKFADIEVSLDDSALLKKNTGIRTLYVTIYDASSSMPMPYGAVKVDLDKDAKGTFYKAELSSENVTVMSGGEIPDATRPATLWESPTKLLRAQK